MPYTRTKLLITAISESESMIKRKKTTIRLSAADEELISNLGQVLGSKMGKIETLSQSEVIRYALRQLAARELNEEAKISKDEK